MGLGKNILDTASLFDKELFDQRVQIDQTLATRKTNELLQKQINNQNIYSTPQRNQDLEYLEQRLKMHPKYIKEAKAKQKEILEQTGRVVSVWEIANVLHEDLEELLSTEEDEMAFLQAKAEAEAEEAEAKIAVQQNTNNLNQQKSYANKSQAHFITIKNITFVAFITLFVILLIFLFVMPNA